MKTNQIDFRHAERAFLAWDAKAESDAWQLVQSLANDLWCTEPLDLTSAGLAEEVEELWSEHVRLGKLGTLPSLALSKVRAPKLRVFQKGDYGLLETPFTLVWIDIDAAEEKVYLPGLTLSHVRRQWIEKAASGDGKDRADKEEAVFLFTVSGAKYLVPDLIFVGPGRRFFDETARGSFRDGIVRVSLSSELQTQGPSVIASSLAHLAKLGSPEHWQELFASGEATDLRSAIRQQLKEHLAEAMSLLEVCAGRLAATDDELRILREAATLIAFRLMFLGEVERRGLLYADGRAPELQFSQLCAMATDAPAELKPGAVLDRFRALCAAMCNPSDDTLALRGASIFASMPSDAFDPGLQGWLGPFDEALRAIDANTRGRWDMLLAGLGSTVLGFLDAHQERVRGQHRRENAVIQGVLGVGGAEHAHRMLGEVYEQVLALEPTRSGGRIVLSLTKKAKSDDGDEASLKKTQTDERRKLGAHYTPEVLVREMVRPALGLLFEQRWTASAGDLGKYAQALKDLRVVDPAMGSGHFLTVAALEIARELAFAAVLGAPTTEHFAQFAGAHHTDADAEREVPTEQRENFTRAVARLIPLVVRRCCHGVDVSPLACELGKLSLWLFTLTVQDADKPELTFLDGNIRCGNSLVGSGWTYAKPIFLERLNVDLDRTALATAQDLFAPRNAETSDIIEKRHEVELLQAALAKQTDDLLVWARSAGRKYLDVSVFPTDGYALRKLLSETVRERLRPLQWVYDLAVLLVWKDVRPRTESALRKRIHDAANSPGAPLPLAELFAKPLQTQDAQVAAYREAIPKVLASIQDERLLRPMHWSLEFPAVFAGARPGFDAVLANPPFVGDRDLRGRLGQELVEYLVARFTSPRNGGTCDLSGFFVLLYDDILARTAAVATTLAPNTLAQAKNRKTVLVPLVNGTVRGEGPHFRIARATQSQVWPGEAAVHVCVVWLCRMDVPHVAASRVTNEDGSTRMVLPLARISTFLDSYRDAPAAELDAFELPSGKDGLFFQGYVLRGADGEPLDFVKPESSAERFVLEARSRGEGDAVYAYLNNDLIQNRPVPIALEACVDFFDVLDEAGLIAASPDVQLSWLKRHFPFCLASIDDVRRARGKLGGSSDDSHGQVRWWMFHRPRPELRLRMKTLSHLALVGGTSKVWCIQFVPTRELDSGLKICFSHACYVMPSSRTATSGVLASAIGELQVRRNCSTLKSDLRFTPESALPTFAFPWASVWSSEQERPDALPPEAAEHGIGSRWDTLLATRRKLLDMPSMCLGENARTSVSWGPTDLYNLYDSAERTTVGIEELRTAHRNLLDVVLRQYGWTELADTMAADEGGGWAFENPWIDRTQRYVPKLIYREQMLEKLMELNEQRYWEEIDLYVPHVVALLSPRPRKLSVADCKAANIKINEEDLEHVLERAQQSDVVVRANGMVRLAER